MLDDYKNLCQVLTLNIFGLGFAAVVVLRLW